MPVPCRAAASSSALGSRCSPRAPHERLGAPSPEGRPSRGRRVGRRCAGPRPHPRSVARTGGLGPSGHGAVRVPFAAPIAVRRRYPAAAVIGISVVLLLQEPFHGQLDLLPTSSWVLGLYPVRLRRRRLPRAAPQPHVGWARSRATSRRPARRDIPDRRRGHRRLEWGAGRADRVLHASVAGGSLRA